MTAEEIEKIIENVKRIHDQGASKDWIPIAAARIASKQKEKLKEAQKDGYKSGCADTIERQKRGI